MICYTGCPLEIGNFVLGRGEYSCLPALEICGMFPSFGICQWYGSVVVVMPEQVCA